MTSRQYKDLLRARGLPTPRDIVRQVRCNFDATEWWVRTRSGWFWLTTSRQPLAWLRAPLGPPGEPGA